MISQSDREERFLSLFEKVRKKVPAPRLQPWIFHMSSLEDKLFGIFLRELCGDSNSGKKLFDMIGAWEKARVLATSNHDDPVMELRRQIGYLRFGGHRKIYHQKYIIGDPGRGVGFRQSAVYDYCSLVSSYASQESFYGRSFDFVYFDLRQVASGGRTFAFDLVESVYRNAVPHPNLHPTKLCLEGSSGPLSGFNLLYFGEREFANRVWADKVANIFGAKEPLWETVEAIGESLVGKAEEQTRLKHESTEFVVFELEDLICNYQKKRKLGVQPERFLNGELTVDAFASAYLSVFGS